VRDIADALTALHRAGIVHRDIKPSNVLVDARDAVRLADFGLARAFADEKGRLTNTGELVGTPHYMAPEQALGFPVGPPADVYALGMVLFTLLAGRPAVEGKGLLEVLTRVGSGELVPLPKLAPDTPEALFSLIAACLKRDAAARPSAGAVVEALDTYLREPAPARPAARRTSPAVVALSALAGVSVLSGLLALAVARRAGPEVAAVSSSVGPVSTGPGRPAGVTRPPPLARLQRGDAAELREVLAGVDALGAGTLSDQQRRELREALGRLEAVWTDPNDGALFVDGARVDATADAVERLVLIHALLRRLDPAHRLPAARRACVDATVFGQLGGRHLSRLGPRFFAELVALTPDAVNAYMVYADATRDTWRHRDVVDLDLLRRGIALARASGQEVAWGRMLHVLSIYLWMKAGTPARDEATAELKALVAEAETSAWSNTDLITSMLYLNQVLNHTAEFDEALAVARRARERAPSEPDPIGRTVVTRIVRAAVRGAPDDAWLDEARAEAEEYFTLKARVMERDEHVTLAMVTALCGALEARGQEAVAEALCARAMRVHDQRHQGGLSQPLAPIACRRVLLLCRLQAPAPALLAALEDAAARLARTAELRAAMRGATLDSAEHRALLVAIDEANTLVANVRAGGTTHADVAARLAASCRPARVVFDLQPLAAPPPPPR
jgi:hypothetical protein